MLCFTIYLKHVPKQSAYINKSIIANSVNCQVIGEDAALWSTLFIKIYPGTTKMKLL